MKTHFQSRELAHVWANEGAPYGRCPANFRFDGDAIYSYGTCIGRRITHKGRTAYVLDSSGFSSSTSKHQGWVRSAVREADKVFYVDCGRRGQSLSFTAESLRDHYMKDYDLRPDVLATHKLAHQKAAEVLRKASYVTKAIEVSTYFKLPLAALSSQRRKMQGAVCEAIEITKLHEEKQRARRIELEATKTERLAARLTASANSFIAGKSDTFLGLERYPHKWEQLKCLTPEMVKLINDRIINLAGEKVESWRNGSNENVYNLPVMLRLEGDEMVTSKGARVPIADAERTYRFVCKVRARGWHSNGEKHAIGMYALAAVNSSGVVAGCHRVSHEEIDLFASTMGWTK